MDQESSQKILNRADAVGMCLSLACAAHCLLLPLALSLLPLIGYRFSMDLHSPLHSAFIFSTVLLSAFTMCQGIRMHRSLRVMLIFLSAVGFFSAAHLLAEGTTQEHMLLGLGGICLAAGHVLNLQLCKSCKSCHQGEPCEE